MMRDPLKQIIEEEEAAIEVVPVNGARIDGVLDRCKNSEKALFHIDSQRKKQDDLLSVASIVTPKVLWEAALRSGLSLCHAVWLEEVIKDLDDFFYEITDGEIEVKIEKYCHGICTNYRVLLKSTTGSLFLCDLRDHANGFAVSSDNGIEEVAAGKDALVEILSRMMARAVFVRKLNNLKKGLLDGLLRQDNLSVV